MDKAIHTLIKTAIDTRQQNDKHINTISELWVCDDNFIQTPHTIDPAIFNPNGNTLFITNRVDTHQAIQHAIDRQTPSQNDCAHSYLSDFDFSDIHLSQLNNNRLDAVYFRIAKEKALSHYVINQAIAYLNSNGRLILVGQKSEGIKGYADRLKKQLKLPVTLEKNGDIYTVTYIKNKIKAPSSELIEGPTGELTEEPTKESTEAPTKTPQLDDQQYTTIKPVHEVNLNKLYNQPDHQSDNQLNTLTIHSKPGVYGWKKFDAGTQLLLQTLAEKININALQSALDLGCGSGVMALALKQFGVNEVVATDNNITAIMATEHNALFHNYEIKTIKDDCAKSINQRFNLVVCNPPFHKGFDTHSPLTTLFVKQAIHKLLPQGEAWFVVNSFVPIEKNINAEKATYKTMVNNKQFKIVCISKK